MRVTTKRQADESPETHILREVADELMGMMWAVMIDADDFDPDDNAARTRSEQAKERRRTADDRYVAGDWKSAIENAAAAMRIMEGN